MSNRKGGKGSFWSGAWLSALTGMLTFALLFLVHHYLLQKDSTHSATTPSNTALKSTAGLSKVVIEDKLMKTVPATSPSTPTTPTNQNSNNNLGNTPASPTIPPSSSIISPRTNASASFLKFADLIKCPASVSEQYAGASSTSSQKAGSDKAWCQNAVSNRGVRVGHSWGSLNKREKDEWEERHCNEYVQTGLQLTCNEKWGWKWLQNWKQNAHQIVSSDSNVKCFVDKIRTSTYCEMENVMMDFSKMNEGGSSRSFQAGFLTIFGAIDHKERAYLPIYPGLHTQFGHPSQCTTYANDTVYMLSNDDIFNLGHYMNDVMNVWMQIVMTEQVGTSSSASSTSPSATAKVLLNIDGLRAGGPAGGHPHRLMVPSAPDSHGPYAPAYYQSWFRGKVTKAVDYKPNKVCFRKLVTLPTPGVPWFWNDWGRINDCAVSAPSPLYQSFSYFLRKQAQQGLGIVLSLPPADKIHIVIEVREINKSKGNNHSSGRYIKNRQALIEELRKIPGVVVTAQNFAALSFTEQIQLAHTASILISMHGAGTTHIFHMAVGSKNCCGLLELFPDPSIEFHTAHGYENLAKMLGFHHRRFVSKAGSTVADGTTLDVQAVGRLARDLVNEVKKKPTCMHDAKDY